MRVVLRAPLLAMLGVPLAACANEYHPEYHPVTVTNVSYVVTAREGAAPRRAEAAPSPVGPKEAGQEGICRTIRTRIAWTQPGSVWSRLDVGGRMPWGNDGRYVIPLRATGFPPGTAVLFKVDNVVTNGSAIDDAGALEGAITLPGKNGSHVVSAFAGGGGLLASTQFDCDGN